MRGKLKKGEKKKKEEKKKVEKMERIHHLFLSLLCLPFVITLR